MVIIIPFFLPFLVSFLPHLSSQAELSKGKIEAQSSLKLAPAHEARIPSFLPSRVTPYVPPHPASSARGGFPRTGVRTRAPRQS